MNFLFDLREAARHCAQPEWAQLLRDAADELQRRIDALAADPTRDNAMWLQCAWAYAERVFKDAPTMPAAPEGQGGALREGARLAA